MDPNQMSCRGPGGLDGLPYVFRPTPPTISTRAPRSSITSYDFFSESQNFDPAPVVTNMYDDITIFDKVEEMFTDGRADINFRFRLPPNRGILCHTL